MELDGPELRALASFYARRFPKKADRLRVAHAAGLTDGWVDAADPEVAWEGLIRTAQQKDRLHDLAEAARSERPKDEHLGELARSLRASARPMSWIWLLLTGICTGVGGYLVGYGHGTEEVRRLAGTEISTQVGTAAVDVRGVPDEDEGEGDVIPVGAEPAADDAVPSPAPDAPVDGVAAPVDAPAAALPEVEPYVAGSALPEGCRGPVGKVVGYWFAGTEAPGRTGTIVTMDKAIRVRADYPRQDNGYNAAAERCVLKPGMRVRVSQEPVVAEGGEVWVPLVPEDVR